MNIKESETQFECKEYNCKDCESKFGSKSNLMMHRKKEHREKVPRCRRFRQGDCELSDDSCWFIHEEITDNDGDTFVDMETEVSEQKEEGFFSQSTGKSAPRSTKTDLRKVRHVISASVSAQEISKQKIEMFREQRRKKQILFQNIKVIKRSEKIFQALKLPKVLNVNPRSLYNKKNEFCTFI